MRQFSGRFGEGVLIWLTSRAGVHTQSSRRESEQSEMAAPFSICEKAILQELSPMKHGRILLCMVAVLGILTLNARANIYMD